MDKKQFYATPKLKELREAKGLSQKEMAEILAVALKRKLSGVTYQKWEQRVRPVKLAVAIEITRELGGSFQQLWVTK